VFDCLNLLVCITQSILIFALAGPILLVTTGSDHSLGNSFVFIAGTNFRVPPFQF
jgi:hypothetical protein